MKCQLTSDAAHLRLWKIVILTFERWANFAHCCLRTKVTTPPKQMTQWLNCRSEETIFYLWTRREIKRIFHAHGQNLSLRLRRVCEIWWRHSVDFNELINEENCKKLQKNLPERHKFHRNYIFHSSISSLRVIKFNCITTKPVSNVCFFSSRYFLSPESIFNYSMIFAKNVNGTFASSQISESIRFKTRSSQRTHETNKLTDKNNIWERENFGRVLIQFELKCARGESFLQDQG